MVGVLGDGFQLITLFEYAVRHVTRPHGMSIVQDTYQGLKGQLHTSEESFCGGIVRWRLATLKNESPDIDPRCGDFYPLQSRQISAPHTTHNPIDHQQRPRSHAHLFTPIDTAPRVHGR